MSPTRSRGVELDSTLKVRADLQISAGYAYTAATVVSYPGNPGGVDLVGLDVRLRILEYLHAMLGEKYRPNGLLKKLVAEGHLGRKTGRGVYDYERQKPQE